MGKQATQDWQQMTKKFLNPDEKVKSIVTQKKRKISQYEDQKKMRMKESNKTPPAMLIVGGKIKTSQGEEFCK